MSPQTHRCFPGSEAPWQKCPGPLLLSAADPLQIGPGRVHDGFRLSRTDAMMAAAVHGKDVTAPPLVRMVFQPVRRSVLKVGLDP